MTFTRSQAGISNQHVFHRADAVVYVEGGSHSFSYAEVRGGKSSNKSIDILYWQSIFRAMAPGRSFRFKPVGSKATLLQLAEDVRQGRITNAYVAMDQDHDRFHETLIEADGVFYTWGYSWENDILQGAALKEAVLSVCPIDRTANEASVDHDIAAIAANFIAQARSFVRADVILSSCGSGLFDRKKWKKYIKADRRRHGQPCFAEANLRDRIRAANSSKGSSRYELTVRPVVTKRDCFGHIIGTFLYRLLCYLVKKYSGTPSISMVMACGLVIQHLRENLTLPCHADVQSHHVTQFAFMGT